MGSGSRCLWCDKPIGRDPEDDVWFHSRSGSVDCADGKHQAEPLNRRYSADSPEFARFKEATHEEHDSNFSYRFMYKLRNFAQHSAFPPLEGRIGGR